MKQVIYVDILFLLNFFITYLLLLTTKKLLKCDAKQYRLILAAVLGGAYSMVIFVPSLMNFVSLLGKLLSAILIVFVAFGFRTWQKFAKGILFFFSSSFLFVGIMIGLWLTFIPNGLIINNASIYFNINAKILILSSLLAYLLSSLIIKIHNRVTAKNQIYAVEVNHDGNKVTFNALADTGNKLREPFSNSPVIVVDSNIVALLFDGSPVRVVPYHTVSGDGILNAYKADCVYISTVKEKVKLENQYIALSKEKFSNGEFGGVINPELLNI